MDKEISREGHADLRVGRTRRDTLSTSGELERTFFTCKGNTEIASKEISWEI